MPSPRSHNVNRIRSLLPSALAGLILGVLGAIAAHRVNLVVPRQLIHPHYYLLVMGALGFVLGLTRLRVLVWAACGFVTGLILFVAYTPFMQVQAPRWIRHDPIRPCPAVVALSTDVWSDGTLNFTAQNRLMGALELLEAGMAEHLVVTRNAPPRVSGLPTVRKRMKMMDLEVPVHEVGPVSNTHDEALAVAALAREQGWTEILLVTSPFHTRRAAETFEKAGLRVVSVPSEETEYELGRLIYAGDRVPAFRDWFKEVIGREVYRRRGWL